MTPDSFAASPSGNPRDPRKNPKRGDAVKSLGESRYVAQIMEYSDGSASVIYSKRSNAMRAKHMTPRSFWVRWAENGEVLLVSIDR